MGLERMTVGIRISVREFCVKYWKRMHLGVTDPGQVAGVVDVMFLGLLYPDTSLLCMDPDGFYYFVTFLDFLSMKTDVNVL
jgi:hypothetical protein